MHLYMNLGPQFWTKRGILATQGALVPDAWDAASASVRGAATVHRLWKSAPRRRRRVRPDKRLCAVASHPAFRGPWHALAPLHFLPLLPPLVDIKSTSHIRLSTTRSNRKYNLLTIQFSITHKFICFNMDLVLIFLEFQTPSLVKTFFQVCFSSKKPHFVSSEVKRGIKG